MKLVSFGPRHAEQPGILIDDETAIVPIVPVLARLGLSAIDMTAVLGLLEYIRPLLDKAATARDDVVPAASVRLGPPIPKPTKAIVCGVNYRSQVADLEATGGHAPRKPPVVLRPNTSISGPFDPVVRWNGIAEIDYEGELVVAIGKAGRNIPITDALSHVAGYMVGQDLISRVIMQGDGDLSPLYLQPTRAKGVDSFSPTGPWLVTADSVPDPRNLEIKTWVDEELRQHGNSGEMITDVPSMIAWLSTTMTLEAGDIIFTGTPSGQGGSFKPPRELMPGQVLRTAITGLGEMINPIIDDPRS